MAGKAFTKRRPLGTCVLCGKPVWTRAVRYDTGWRHHDCQPGGKTGARYSVAHGEGKERTQ